MSSLLLHGNATQGFNPSSIDGLELWLDAAADSTIAGDPNVTSWADKSGNDYAATKNGSNNAVLGTDGDGYPNITIDGTASGAWFQVGAVGDFDFVHEEDCTIFFVHRPTPATPAGIEVYASTRNGNTPGFTLFGNGQDMIFGVRNNTTAVTNLTTPGDLDYIKGQQRQISMVTSDAQDIPDVRFYQDGVGFVQSGDFANPQQVGTAPVALTIGKNPANTSGNYTGSFYEILIYSRSLTGTEQAAVSGYLNNKWNILPDTLDLMILVGDDNAVGGAPISGASGFSLSDNIPDKFIYGQSVGAFNRLNAGGTNRAGSTSTFGPEMNMMIDYAGSSPLTMLKVSQDATSLAADWARNSGGTLWMELSTELRNARQQLLNNNVKVNIVGAAIVNGLTDAQDSGQAAAYEQNLEDFISYIRDITGNPTLPIALAKLNVAAAGYSFEATVQAAQANVATADANVTLINTDAYGFEADNIHWNAAAMQSLGGAIAGIF